MGCPHLIPGEYAHARAQYMGCELCAEEQDAEEDDAEEDRLDGVAAGRRVLALLLLFLFKGQIFRKK